MKQLRILAKMAGLNPPYGQYFSNGFSRMNPSLGFRFHEDAALDIEESVAFYRYEAGINVATSFVDEVERVLGLLSQNSSLGRRVTNKVRKFGLTTFPYSVVY